VAQFVHAMSQKLLVAAILASGDYQQITDWQIQNSHHLGAMLTPARLVQRVTGEPLNPQYRVDWMTATYERNYQVAN